jgi:hypothetical protein
VGTDSSTRLRIGSRSKESPRVESRTGAFTVPLEPANSFGKEIQPLLDLKASQEIQIQIELESAITCATIKIAVMSVFGNR